jgi:hypothetical protein
VGGGAAGALAGRALGDVVIGTVFGIRGDVDPTTYALLAASSVLAACALVATVTLVVEGRSRRILVAWGLPAISAAVVTASGVIADPIGLATWLLIAHATVCVLALAPALRGGDRGTAGPNAHHDAAPTSRLRDKPPATG